MGNSGRINDRVSSSKVGGDMIVWYQSSCCKFRPQWAMESSDKGKIAAIAEKNYNKKSSN